MDKLDVGIITGYFILLLMVGIIGSKRATTSDDYIVAGRRLNIGMFFACLCALLLGGASTIGTTTLGFQFGLSGMWLVTMLGLGIAFIGIFLIKKIFNMKIFTISQLLTNRYGQTAGFLSAVVSVIYAMMVCATQIIAMGTVIQVFTGWSMLFSMLVVGGLVIVYTILGGMWAITLTDLIQFGLIVAGIMFIMLPRSLLAAGGFQMLKETLPASYFNITSIGGKTIVQYFFLYALGAMVGQDIWQRFFTARSVKVARVGGIGVCFYAVLYSLTCSVIGMCAKLIISDIQDTQLVFGTLAKTILPPGLLGIVLASVLAVLMSTAAGTLLASSSVLSNDIIKPLFAGDISDKGFLFMSRGVTTVIGIMAMTIAVALNNILAALDVSYAILSGALFFPIILGIFWKRATARAALISMICSTAVIITGLFIHGVSSIFPIVYGLTVSGIVMVFLTLWENGGKRNNL